ncbi:MAG: metallophosphoesterase [Spirochaetes bacterium]|nr:metallophosphoesterase [Spirochaetota bacterium]
MKLLVVSDTHGDVRYLAAVLKRLKDVDLVIHCGDGAGDMERARHYGVSTPPYIQVHGNTDPAGSFPGITVASAASRRILVSHGHHLVSGDSIQSFVCAAKEAGAHAFFFGHTHVPFLERSDGVLVLNPGSLSRPRGGYEASFAVADVPEDPLAPMNVSLYEIIARNGHLSFSEIP